MERWRRALQVIKELAKEVKMPSHIFKYSAERGLAYSTTLAKMADDIEEVVAMKTSCFTCADYTRSGIG